MFNANMLFKPEHLILWNYFCLELEFEYCLNYISKSTKYCKNKQFPIL